MVCPECNIEIPDDSTFCGSCGAQIAPPAESAPGFDSGGGPAPNREDYPFASPEEAWRILTGNVGEFLLATVMVVAASAGLSITVRLIVEIPAVFVGGVISEGGEVQSLIATIIVIVSSLVSSILATMILGPLHVKEA